MAKEEYKGEWNDLCSYIEREILGYNENQKLQKAACLRIQGLTRGQSIANSRAASSGNYTYGEILKTFQIYKNKILNAIRGKNFNGEANKVGYICAIVRNYINEVATRMRNAEKSLEKADKIYDNIYENLNQEYLKKTSDDMAMKFKELW